jgi:hypothetical protein
MGAIDTPTYQWAPHLHLGASAPLRVLALPSQAAGQYTPPCAKGGSHHTQRLRWTLLLGAPPRSVPDLRINYEGKWTV